jgi:hypothetical protein
MTSLHELHADRGRLREQLFYLERDVGILERKWDAYKRRHPKPAFAPTAEQLPHYDAGGDVQLAIL